MESPRLVDAVLPLLCLSASIHLVPPQHTHTSVDGPCGLLAQLALGRSLGEVPEVVFVRRA